MTRIEPCPTGPQSHDTPHTYVCCPVLNHAFGHIVQHGVKFRSASSCVAAPHVVPTKMNGAPWQRCRFLATLTMPRWPLFGNVASFWQPCGSGAVWSQKPGFFGETGFLAIKLYHYQPCRDNGRRFPGCCGASPPGATPRLALQRAGRRAACPRRTA